MYTNRYFLQLLFFVVTIVALFISCNGRDRKQVMKIESDEIYFDYNIWGDEGGNLVTVTLQYRQGDASGEPVSLIPPAGVKLDGDQLQADSSVMNGVYYEASSSVADFAGKHQIIFTDAIGKVYTENFEFATMRLKSEPSTQMDRQDLVFYLEGLDSSDFVHVVMTDTSFYSRGIDRVDTVREGKIVISESDLENLQNGPVFLEFYKERSWPLKETGTGGGSINLSYSLKRSFLLRELADGTKDGPAQR